MNPIAETLAIPADHLQSYSEISPGRFRQHITGKSAIITGGGYGIGAAIAKAYAEAGIKEVILVGRTLGRLTETASSLSKLFPKTTFTSHVIDIAKEADVIRFFKALSYAPDILVNNAGYLAEPANFVTADLHDFWKVFQINVLGTIQFTQNFLKHRKSYTNSTSVATVITLNTIGAYNVRVPGLASYGASKAALARWNELIAVDVPDTEARFISLHPGAVKTDMGAKSGLEGAFPSTEAELSANFTVFCSTELAGFLSGRFAWVNWDVEKLLAKKDEIVSKDLLRTSLTG